jgi:hypothetical protein
MLKINMFASFQITPGCSAQPSKPKSLSDVSLFRWGSDALRITIDQIKEGQPARLLCSLIKAALIKDTKRKVGVLLNLLQLLLPTVEFSNFPQLITL